jgi:hypothetical protein
VLDQLVKGCQLAIHSAVILAQENQELRAANKKQVKNSKRSKKQIPYQGSLTIKEGAQLLQDAQVADKAMEEAIQQEASDALNMRQHAPPRCSNCHLIGHKRTQCMQQPR